MQYFFPVFPKNNMTKAEVSPGFHFSLPHPAFHCAIPSIFSINIPYPLCGRLTMTCVTAPTSLPFCKMGEPDTFDVH